MTTAFSTVPTGCDFFRSAPFGTSISEAGSRPRPVAHFTNRPNGSILSTVTSSTSPTLGVTFTGRGGAAGRSPDAAGALRPTTEGFGAEGGFGLVATKAG